jgi:mannose-6-phosphate isomerase-like protein (cupin superfamily)
MPDRYRSRHLEVEALIRPHRWSEWLDMIPVGTTWENPRTGSKITILECSDERCRAERLIRPHTGKADEHVHLDFEQSFTVTSGRAVCEIDGKRIEIPAGQRADVPRGARHIDSYNATGEDVVMELEITPNSDFVTTFVATLGDLMVKDDLDDQEFFKPLQLFAVLHAGRAQSFRTGIPIPIQKPMIAAAATIARARGVKVVAARR